MSKYNRYWRCSDKNHSRITVKNTNEAPPTCKKCGEVMKREGRTKNKQGTLKSRRQVHGELVNITASRIEDMRLRQSQLDTARKNCTGIPWKEEPLSWHDAAKVYKRQVDIDFEKHSIKASTKEAYLRELENILGSDPKAKKDPRWVKRAIEINEKRQAYYRKLREQDPTVMDIRDKAVQDVTVRDVDNFLLCLRHLGVATLYINHTLQRIHAVYKELTKEFPVEQYQRLHNARLRLMDASGLKDRYTEDNPKPETPILYNAEEMDFLLSHYEPYPEYHFVMFMCMKLMVRVTAAKSFRVSDFNFEELTWKTPLNSKGGKVGMTMPMPESVAIYLQKWMADRNITKGWLLRSPYKAGRRWQGRTSLIQRVQMQMAKELEAQGRHEEAARLGALRSHTIGRHTGSSIMQYLKPATKQQQRTRANLLTHSNPKTTQQFYTHKVDSEERRLIDAYDDFTSIPGKVILPPPPFKLEQRKRDGSNAALQGQKEWRDKVKQHRLAALAKKGKLSAVELAAELGVSEVSVHRWRRRLEAGQTIPNPRKTDAGYSAEFRRAKIPVELQELTIGN